jgi:glutamate synthase domain-containing protein 1
MCGIVGLFLTDPALETNLGRLTAGMLAVMTDRGPDSAGFALCGVIVDDTTKLTLHAPPSTDFNAIAALVGEALGVSTLLVVRDDHAVLRMPARQETETRTPLA